MLLRIITALILAPIVLFSITVDYYFIILIFIVIAIAVFEFSKLIIKNKPINTLFFAISLYAIIFLLYIFTNNFRWIYLIIGSVWWLFNFAIIINYPALNTHIQGIKQNFIRSILLFLPAIFSLLFLQKEKPVFLLLLFSIVWGADIFAYFIGKMFGKQKLLARLSAGKTIIGVIGGIIGALLLTIVFLLWQNIPTTQYFYYLVLTIIVAVFSIIGDLFISAYKREAQVKDSGNILPGHGGILDRIDSILAAAPIFTLGLII